MAISQTEHDKLPWGRITVSDQIGSDIRYEGYFKVEEAKLWFFSFIGFGEAKLQQQRFTEKLSKVC